MSDRKGIYYGTIQETNESNIIPTSVQKGVSIHKVNDKMNISTSGHVHTANTNIKEVLEFSETSILAQEKHAQILRRMEAEKRARNISVPTITEEIISRLRQLNEPITYFGEDKADRRERLRQILARLELETEENGYVQNYNRNISTDHEEKEEFLQKDGKLQQKDAQKELFYIPMKTNTLKQARNTIYLFGQLQTPKRLKIERTYQEINEKDIHAARLYDTAKRMVIIASQNGGTRPLSSVRYSPDNTYIATGCWNNEVKIWDAQSAEEIALYQAHDNRITFVDWHPKYKSGATESVVALCSASADGTAKLWGSPVKSLNNEDNVKEVRKPLMNLVGHKARLGKIAFHPSGDYIGTTSFDHTWRLWDVKTGEELLLQEGHYKEVYAIAFQKNDGVLAVTGDLNGLGRVWDLRSGKCICPLQGHSKQILSLDFAVNDIHIASGSDDRTVRLWDLRQRKCMYTLPAHSGLVSEVQYSRGSSELLLSASFDNTIKLWRTRDWQLMSTLKGHDDKVTSADFAADERHIVSCGFDRTFKFWAHENEF